LKIPSLGRLLKHTIIEDIDRLNFRSSHQVCIFQLE
jgi:hypothetical protein